MKTIDYVMETLSYLDVLLQPNTGPRVVNSGPKPLVSPFGPGYSMHPELSRSGLGYLLARTIVPTIIVGTVVGSFVAERSALETIVASESTPSWWKTLVLSGI